MEEDTTKLLWEYLFMCRVPLLATLSDIELRTFGTVHTGHGDIDRGTKEQYVTVMWPISKMATYYNKGVNIKVIKYADTSLIYEYVTKHLEFWAKRIKYGINVGDAPLADLIVLDEFASSVYEHAKHNVIIEEMQDSFAKHMLNVSVINATNFFEKPITKDSIDENGIVRINQDEKTTLPERDSYEDLFKDRLIGSNRWS